MKFDLKAAVPATILAIGLMASQGVSVQHAPALRMSLQEALPTTVGEYAATEVKISDAELTAVGATSYLYRTYSPATNLPPAFTLYVGYYASQAYGRTIHSPKNCLPGAGWQALSSEQVTVNTADGPVMVNRYLLQNGEQRALALYWYQGRGRVEANEYQVKWDLLRDAARSGRSEEALVRVLVPVTGSEDTADELAVRVASQIIPSVSSALPI